MSAHDWVSFWDSKHSIYVNARHFDAHYRDIANHIVALLPGPFARVLDFGCGEALHADRIAASAAEVIVSDAAPAVRKSIATRFAHNAKIKVLSPEEVERQPEGSLDLIVANSVAQYLSAAELDRLLLVWRRLLAPGGSLIVGDVIPPDTSAVGDAMALLRYAAKNGFLLAAVGGLARTVVSPYRRLRSKLGIVTYSEADFRDKLRGAGFAAERLSFNLEHNPTRITFRARPAS